MHGTWIELSGKHSLHVNNNCTLAPSYAQVHMPTSLMSAATTSRLSSKAATFSAHPDLPKNVGPGLFAQVAMHEKIGGLWWLQH